MSRPITLDNGNWYLLFVKGQGEEVVYRRGRGGGGTQGGGAYFFRQDMHNTAVSCERILSYMEIEQKWVHQSPSHTAAPPGWMATYGEPKVKTFGDEVLGLHVAEHAVYADLLVT